MTDTIRSLHKHEWQFVKLFEYKDADAVSPIYRTTWACPCGIVIIKERKKRSTHT